MQVPDMYARSVAFSHDGKQLAGAGDRRLAIWSTDDWKQQQTRATGDRHIRAVCFHPSKSQLLIGYESGLVQWDLDSNKTLQMAGPAPSQIYWANYSAEGQHAAYYFGLTIAIQDLSQPHQSGYAVPLSGASDHLVLTAAFNRSGSRLAAAGTNRVIMIWKRGAFRPEIALHGHHGSILNVIWNSEDRLFSLDDNGKLLGWTADHVHAWTTHVDAAPSYSRMHVLADIPDRDEIAVGTSDQGVLIVDSISGEINRRIDVDLAVQAVACDPNGQWLAWCNSGGQLTIMNLETKKVVANYTISDSDVRAIAFSPDSRSIAVAGKRMTWLYDIDANAIRWVRPNGAPVWGAAFSRSGRRLIISTGTQFDYAHVIDADDGEQVDRIPSGEMFDVAHDPTNDTVVLYGSKGRICRFEVGGTETTAARLVPPNAIPIKIPYKLQRESRGYSLSGQRGNEDRALSLAEEAWDLVPGCPEYRLTKAMALHRSGHYDDALEQLLELDGIAWNTSSRDDFNPPRLTVLGQIFLALTLNALDRQDEAKANLETAREMVESTFSSDGLVNSVFNEAVNSINKSLTVLSKAAD